MKNQSKSLKSLLITCLVLDLFLFAACQHKSNSTNSQILVSGCKDPTALNYNPHAEISTSCTYTTSVFAGTYYMTDTLISFRHDLTRGWYDTSVSHFDITVCPVGNDSMHFDKIVRCPFCASENISVGGTECSFSFINNDYPVTYGGSGYFTHDTLILNYGTTPWGGIDGTYRHRSFGIKQ